ncbi:MAG: cation transporter [Candidatus Xenobia bacterium]
MNEDANGTGTTGKAIGLGVMAAILAALCCVGPAVLGVLGLGTLAAAFYRHGTVFEVLAVLLLSTGILVLVRQKTRDDACCPPSGRRHTGAVILLALLGFGVGLAGLRQVVPPALQAQTRTAIPGAVDARDQGRMEVHINGMDCASCAAGLQASLQSLPGVISAQVDYRHSHGSTVYDTRRTSPPVLMRAIEAAGLKAIPEQPARCPGC